MSVFNFIILLTFIALSEGGPITFEDVMEGDSIKLNFSFPCISAKVTLRHGYKAPFYDSSNPESMPVSNRYILMLHKEKEDQNCSLQLEIKPVLRSDEGGYILTAYGDDGNILNDSKIGLRVDHPPGVVSCEWVEENIVDDWGSMLCKAPAGSTPGLIACYQNGIRLPPKTTPTETGDVLQQTIWMRYFQVAFCCTSLQEKLIDKCECKDFVWDPSHSGNSTDPCAAPLQDPIPSPNPEVVSEKNSSAAVIFTPTPQTNTKNPAVKKANLELLVVIGTLIFIIIINCAFLIAAFLKVRQMKRMSQQNGPYKSVPSKHLA